MWVALLFVLWALSVMTGCWAYSRGHQVGPAGGSVGGPRELWQVLTFVTLIYVIATLGLGVYGGGFWVVFFAVPALLFGLLLSGGRVAGLTQSTSTDL